jgi:hypothetical protein
MFRIVFCRVKWLSTDVSEVRTAPIIREPWIRQYIPEDNSEQVALSCLNFSFRWSILFKGGGSQPGARELNGALFMSDSALWDIYKLYEF